MKRFYALLLLLPGLAQAWSNHALGTGLALQPWLQDAPPVAVEPLEQFIATEREGLVALLAQQEASARRAIAHYPPLHDTLRFGGERTDAQALLRALRLNPAMRLNYFVQPVPGTEDWRALEPLPQADVLVYKDLSGWADWRFYALVPGQAVSPLAVLASAADEPDYGMDINLFSDGGSEHGELYGFGPQPFGADGYEHASQAPFHMLFVAQPWIVRALAPQLSRTYPPLRAHQFFDLARFAFATGHDYWGYRFAGWGLHYVQDLTQPYHSRLMPGFSTAHLLWLHAKAALGWPQAQTQAIDLVAHRHTLLESRQLAELQQQLAGAGEPTLARALADDSGDAHYPAFDAAYLHDVVAAQSHAAAGDMDALLAQAPGPELEALVASLTRHFGSHSRQALAAVRAAPAAAQARH